MRVSLLGLQGSGKTTVLNAVAEKPVTVPPGSLQTETHVQVVKVRDPRLERCRDLFRPKKYTPAGLELWDPPGLPSGTAAADRDKRTRMLGALRDADAYVLVVRAFRTDNYPYERPQPDPAADLAQVVDELVLADLVVAEGRVKKLKEALQKGASRTADQDRLELGVLEKCVALLESDPKGMADLALDEADRKRIRGFQFFSRKPFLLLWNGPGEVPTGFADASAIPFLGRFALDAQLEAELNSMDPESRPAFMAEFGISEPASERFVHEVYRAAGLRSFFTVGEDEVRAWTIRAGDDAITAAGKIHTDLAKGFVRAEVFAYEDLVAAGGMRELKARNGIRLEPKDYVVKDGDIVHIRSAV